MVLKGRVGVPLKGWDIITADLNISGLINAHIVAPTAPKSCPMTHFTSLYPKILIKMTASLTKLVQLKEFKSTSEKVIELLSKFLGDLKDRN